MFLYTRTQNTSASTPEDARRVPLDLVDQLVDVRRRFDQVVLVELQVPVTPVRRPLLADPCVAESTDREARPLRAEVVPPRRAALEHGDRAVAHVDLMAGLIPSIEWDLVVAPFDPSLDPDKVEIRDHVASAYRCQRILDAYTYPGIIIVLWAESHHLPRTSGELVS